MSTPAELGSVELAAAALADAALAAPPRLGSVRLVAVDGPSGSGKSTLADALAATLAARGTSVALIRTDDFATWDAPTSWWPRLADGVLGPLSRGEPGRYRPTVWAFPRGPVDVPVPDVLLVEGVSSARRRVAPWLSLAVWVELAGAAARLERSVARDGEAERAHLAAWQRFEAGWFVVDDTRDRCAHRVSPGPAMTEP